MSRLVVDEIVQTYDLDPKSFNAKYTQIKAKMKSLMTDDVGRSPHSMNFMTSAMGVLGAAVVGVGAGFVAMGVGAKKAFTEFAAFDGLLKSLESVSETTQQAQDDLKSLYALAKAPGIGFQEAVRAHVQNRNAGMNADFSLAMIREIANANAKAGGGKETFGRAMLAVNQMALKPFLQGEELLQLMEAGIPVQRMVKERFGTSDTEELKKRGIASAMVLEGLLKDLEKLPRVNESAATAVETFDDAVQRMWVNLGSALQGIAPYMSKFADTIGLMAENNVFKSAVEGFLAPFSLLGAEGANFEDVLLRITAGFVGLGTYMKNFFEGAQMAFSWLFENSGLARLIKLIFGVDAKVNGGALGKFFEDAFGVTAASDFYTNAKATLDANRNNKARELDTSKSGLGDNAATSTTVPILTRIAENTDPLRELASQILGGGAMARNAINRQDLSDIRTGRRSGDPVENAVRGLVDAIKVAVVSGSAFSAGGRQF